MIKKIIAVSSIIFGLVVALPAFAETVGAPASGVSTTSEKITCVGMAVATRESALGVAVSVHSKAVSDAYATRATELSGAYSNTTAKTVQTGVKTAWDDFSKSVKSAQKAWNTSKMAAWSQFRTAVKTCKAPATVSDASGASSEVSGQ